ncbi:MAG: Maf family nucleotide pyrophosphatase [Agarilytica sp.]
MLQLASKSPRRRELLDQIGVPYKVVSVDVPELRHAHESPQAYVSRLALDKSRAGVRAFPGAPTLGADTIVCKDDQVLEKPKDFGDFKNMMRLLSGGSHVVITSIAMSDGEQECLTTASTQVRFRDIRDEEIERYWLTGEPKDKAGGYAIQGFAAVFVSEIHGSYSNVVGLPIETLSPLLAEFDIPIWEAVKK